MNSAPKTQQDSRTARQKIERFVERHGPSTPKTVAEEADVNYNTVKSTMNRMKGDELALKNERIGSYDLKERVESEVQPKEGDPIYDNEAEAGDGLMEFEEEPIGHMPPSQSLSSAGRDVFWMPVVGDSMGEKYKKLSLVPVAKFTDPVDDFAADDVYVIRWDGAVKIKRLQRLSGQRVRIISDNDAYPNEMIELDDGTEFEIIGRVLV